MFKIALVSLAGATLALAAPALAAPSDATGSNAVAAQDATGTAPATTASERRYCVDEDITGSRLSHRICLTHKAWLDRGFDPLAK